MDIITQGLIGGALAQAGARQKDARIATLVGFFAGLLADADAFIHSSEDPLLYLEFHRHFSHALFFVPIGALLASLILWPLMKSRLAFSRVYYYAFLGYVTSGFLDACTSYGTSLLWPFSDDRIAWSIISIFDPLFSVILIIAIVIGIVKFKPVAARVGLLLAGLYLVAGMIQHGRAVEIVMEMASQKGHQAERLIVKPTMDNIVLWRTVYLYKGNFYVNAVRVGFLDGSRVYEGEMIAAFDQEKDLPNLSVNSILFKDIARFRHFSDGYLAMHPSQPNILGDVRYSILPTSARPLWGIELKIDRPGEHTPYNFYRNFSKQDRELFLSMMFNRAVSGLDVH